MKTEQLKEYMEVKTEFQRLKDKELELRMAICDELLNGQTVGSHNFEFDDFTVKATKKINISLDLEALDENFSEFTDEEKECIKFKPTLKMKEYKLAKDMEEVDVLDDCITVKDATPTLEVDFEGIL